MRYTEILKSFLTGLLLLSGLHAEAQTTSALKINEVMAANVDIYVDPSWNYGGWIEVYNPTSKDMNLKGCWVSDDPTNLQKIHVSQSTPIAAHGFANLWFDHHDWCCPSQMNMKLDCDGGTIYLSNTLGKVIDQVEYPVAIPRNSWARTTDGTGDFEWTASPTPEASNNDVLFATQRLEAPQIDKDSQLFKTTLRVTVQIPEGATLRYTLDGSTPTLTNGYTSTSGVLTVAHDHVYRFALFKDGYLSSPVVTRSYFRRDKNFTLPIVSIVTDPDNLYSNEMGVFVQGTNGRAGKGTDQKCNWNMDWDRPVNFEYISSEGKSLCNVGADLSRCGGHSKGFTPFSFKVKASKQYEGQNFLPYQFFEDQPYVKHKALQMRNGANDYLCRVKDAFIQSLIRTSGIDMDLQNYQPVVHYINGVYKGTINMRSPNNKHNVYANHGLDDDEIDMFEIECDSCYVQMCGTADAWQRLKTLSASASDASVYQDISENLLDIDEFCNYMAVQMYLGNTDWPQNNQKAWRPIADNGKFRFILYDTDFAFSTTDMFNTFAGRQWCTFCQLYNVPGVSNYTREVELVPIFLNLLNNTTFRKHFIDTYCLVAGSVFEPTRCEQLIRQWTTRVYSMQILDDNGYGRNVSPWSTANDCINGFNGRPASMYSTLKNYSKMKLSGVTAQKIKMSTNIDEARLQVNDQLVPLNQFDGQLFPPVTLRASAPVGYRFLGWKNNGDAASLTSGETVFDYATEWAYYDKGSLDGIHWYASSYKGTTWSNGKAPLGYSSNALTFNTTLSYGSDESNKYPTYYFRKSLYMEDDPETGDQFTLNYVLDDGFVLYVNGSEVGRVNMPDGTPSYSTYTTTSASTEPISGSLSIPNSLLHEGVNVFAVEVHNISATSSDIYWDAQLQVTHNSEAEQASEYLSTEEVINMPTSAGTLDLVACYEPINLEQTESSTPAPGSVRINEVSASNSVFVNEYFKKEDWIELYNTTDHDIDLEGMYLTDDASNPTLCRITKADTETSTILPANGYQIIWCDKEDTQSQLHANFKLSNQDNSYVILTSADQTWADTLIYCNHEGSESVGRFPDGGKQVFKMYNSTIGKMNQMNLYTSLWVADEMPYIEPTGIEQEPMLASHEGGMSVICTAGMLRVKSEENPDVTLSIYTLSGQEVAMQPMTLTTGHDQFSISMLARGTYIARVTDSQGNQCACKFNVK